MLSVLLHIIFWVVCLPWSFDFIPFIRTVKKHLPVILPKLFPLCSWPGWIYVFFFQDLVAYQENCKKDVSLIERNSQSILQCVASTEVLQHFHQSTFQKKVTQVQITFQVKMPYLGTCFWRFVHMQLVHPIVPTFHHSVAAVLGNSPLWCQAIN